MRSREGKTGSGPRRRTWLALMMAMALALAACGGDGDDAGDEPVDGDTEQTEAEETEAEETEPEEEAGGEEETGGEAEEAAAELDCARIDFVVPVAAGGGSDLYTRTIYGNVASQILDIPVQVRNVPGDAQMLGVGEVFRADPDGCTMTTYNPPSITISQISRGEDAPIDIRDAAYVGGWGSASLTLFGHVDSPGEDFAEVMELYQSGELSTYGAQDRAGPTELLGHILRDNYGMEWEELVAYDGGGDLAAAVLRQEVPYGITTDTSIQDQVANGEFKVIAVLTDEPSTILEGAPTLIEQGDYESLDYIAAFTRLVATVPDTPEPQRQALELALQEAIESEEIQSWAEESGNPVRYIPGDRAAEIVENSFNIADAVPNIQEILAGE